jgi:hypothetical protein
MLGSEDEHAAVRDVMLMEAASAAREIATMTALLLIRSGGDPVRAIEMASEIEAADPFDGHNEDLNALSISAQAIREAMAYRGGPA